MMVVLFSVSLVKTNVYGANKGDLSNREISISESKNDSKKNLLSLDEFNRKYSNQKMYSLDEYKDKFSRKNKN